MMKRPLNSIFKKEDNDLSLNQPYDKSLCKCVEWYCFSHERCYPYLLVYFYGNEDVTSKSYDLSMFLNAKKNNGIKIE